MTCEQIMKRDLEHWRRRPDGFVESVFGIKLTIAQKVLLRLYCSKQKWWVTVA